MEPTDHEESDGILGVFNFSLPLSSPSPDWRTPPPFFLASGSQMGESAGRRMICAALERDWLWGPVTHVQGEWMRSLMNPPQPPVDKTQHCVDTRRPDSTPSCLLFSLSQGLSLINSGLFHSGEDELLSSCCAVYQTISMSFNTICLMAFILKDVFHTKHKGDFDENPFAPIKKGQVLKFIVAHRKFMINY